VFTFSGVKIGTPFSRAVTVGVLNQIFVRVVLVRDERDDVVAARQQQIEALVANLAVAEK
jgi:hypothetical protein